MKKILLLVFVSLFAFLNYDISFAAAPEINCTWIPGCVDKDMTKPSPPNLSNNIWAKFMANVIWEFIQLVAVFAVFALIFSWVMYLLSSWDEEKANKAKKWIIWSLVGVLLSISAWGIINFLNNVRINNWWASSWTSASASIINFRIWSEVYDTRETAWDYPIVPDWYTEWQQVTPSEYIAVE